MPAKIIDGIAIAAAVRKQAADAAAAMAAAGHRVHLTAVLVGATAAGELYAQRQGQAAADIGIGYNLLRLPADATEAAVVAEIDRLNRDKSVTGILLHLPLPKHLDA